MTPGRRWLLPGSLAVVLAVLLSAGVQGMALFGHDGWSAARRGVAARNFVRRGLVATRFAPVESPAGTPPGELVYYPNHPALTSLLVALAVWLLGQSEWVLRTPPILFTLAAFLLSYDLARRHRGSSFAVTAALATLAMPIVTYYGSFVNHEPIVAFATIAMISAYGALRTGGGRGALAALVAAVALGGLDDWSFYLALGPFALVAFVDGRRRGDLAGFVAIALTACATLAIVAAHALSLPGESLELFRERLEGRSTLNVGFFEVISDPAVPPRFLMLLGPILAVAALAAPVVTLLRSRAGRADYLDAAVCAVWSGALAYSVLLSEGLRNHDYWIFLFAPCASLGVATLIEEARRPAVLRAIVLVPSLVWGLCALWDYRRLPTELAEEWPDFRFAENQVMRHVHRRTRPGELVLFEEALYLQHQSRYYLDRPWVWFRGQLGLREWAIDEGASMIVIPAETADGESLADLGRHHRLTAFEDHWVIDLGRGPGAVDARRVVFRGASLAWRYLRSLAYSPYRVAFDPARSADLTAALGARHAWPSRPARAPASRDDMDARLARANAGDASALSRALPIEVRAGHGAIADVLGARVDPGPNGGVEVWLVVRARGPGSAARPIVWASGQPDAASDRELWPRVPEAWWQAGRVYGYHRVLGLGRGPHTLFLRADEDGALGLGRDVLLATVRESERLPLLGRY
ncbi:MAG: glycosyltransferase family 39 protein [Deltaproteobacteria bacterium]|nr:glycosyltransferase family 39 protein [Deltaproteobacteria bacterium]